MVVTEQKKYEYWNHFMTAGFLGYSGKPKQLTAPRLRAIQSVIWNDETFWDDIVSRHSGGNSTPEQMRERWLRVYEHCQGNFWGMLMQTAVEMGLIKP